MSPGQHIGNTANSIAILKVNHQRHLQKRHTKYIVSKSSTKNTRIGRETKKNYFYRKTDALISCMGCPHLFVKLSLYCYGVKYSVEIDLRDSLTRLGEL